jgi:hypothetical protein
MPNDEKNRSPVFSSGKTLPTSGSRTVSFAERARGPRSPEEKIAERPTRFPPAPGDLPDCGPIDSRLILNRDDSEE